MRGGCAWLIAAMLGAGCTQWVDTEVDGRALNWVTKEPVPNVRIELRCSRMKPVQGSELVRKITVESDGEGRYHFDAAHSKGCDWVFVSAEKAGYTDASDLGFIVTTAANHRRPPQEIYLVAKDDITIEQLKHLTAWIDPTLHTMFISFLRSKKIAKQPRELQWMRENYCERLVASFAKLTEQERPRYLEPTRNVDPPSRGWDKEVTEFCATAS